jgi:magnesium chelatase family protein
MGLACTRSVALVGVQGHIVEVEADLAQGLPGFALVGLPDTALSESRDRVRAAVVNSGEIWPQRRITVSLSPASLPKRGSGFDLPIAVAVLAGAGAMPSALLDRVVLLGELGLDGRLRAVRGVLPAVMAAVRSGSRRIIVPWANATEASLVPEAEVLSPRSLRELLAILRGEEPPVDDTPALDDMPFDEPPAATMIPQRFVQDLDLADVRGQVEARRALEVVAAGGHHLFLVGPPGAGKTMLAERLPGLLPPLETQEALEVTAVHSVAGLLAPGQPLVTRPPFCNPHHTASVPSVVGGGSGLARPGAVSLAHRGILFLDEAPEFPSRLLDALRQPLESGEVFISRAAGSARFPARCVLVLAANPCPCGHAFGSRSPCECTPQAARRYLGRISGPLLDRIDLRLGVCAPTRADLAEGQQPESTAVVAERVRCARERSRSRLAGTPWRLNSEVPGRLLRSQWRATSGGGRIIHHAIERGLLSARGADRILRVSWTVADLWGDSCPAEPHVQEALSLRINASGVAA